MAVHVYIGTNSYLIDNAQDTDLEYVTDLVSKCIFKGAVVSYQANERTYKVISFADVKSANVSLDEPHLGPGPKIPLDALAQGAFLVP